MEFTYVLERYEPLDSYISYRFFTSFPCACSHVLNDDDSFDTIIVLSRRSFILSPHPLMSCCFQIRD